MCRVLDGETRPQQLRIVNFNVYMGYDRLGEDNTFRVGRLLKDLGADVAALQVGEKKTKQYNSSTDCSGSSIGVVQCY